MHRAQPSLGRRSALLPGKSPANTLSALSAGAPALVARNITFSPFMRSRGLVPLRCVGPRLTIFWRKQETVCGAALHKPLVKTRGGVCAGRTFTTPPRLRQWQGISYFPLSWGQGDLFPCRGWGSAPQTLGENKRRGVGQPSAVGGGRWQMAGLGLME